MHNHKTLYPINRITQTLVASDLKHLDKLPSSCFVFKAPLLTLRTKYTVLYKMPTLYDTFFSVISLDTAKYVFMVDYPKL